MKLSLIVAVVVLALAQGSPANVTSIDIQRITQYIEDMRTNLTAEIASTNQDLVNHAQNIQSQLDLAAQVQEQIAAFVTKVQEQIRPAAENVQAQFQPLFDELQRQVEGILQRVTDQAKTIGN